jgi:hypothetical protein
MADIRLLLTAWNNLGTNEVQACCLELVWVAGAYTELYFHKKNKNYPDSALNPLSGRRYNFLVVYAPATHLSSNKHAYIASVPSDCVQKRFPCNVVKLREEGSKWLHNNFCYQTYVMQQNPAIYRKTKRLQRSTVL